jgi:hypothetical protein
MFDRLSFKKSRFGKQALIKNYLTAVSAHKVPFINHQELIFFLRISKTLFLVTP